jgi:hypothetical protein
MMQARMDVWLNQKMTESECIKRMAATAEARFKVKEPLAYPWHDSGGNPL